MIKIIITLFTFLLSLNLKAQDRFEIGIGAGSSLPVNGSDFKKAASAGDSQIYWLGYGLDENWGVELGLDQFDFDSVNSKHKAIILGGVYRILPEYTLHPITKLGLTSVESTSLAGLKTSSLGIKASAGLEVDFKVLSLGVLFNLHHVSKTDDLADYKNTQALLPTLFLTFHNCLGETETEKSTPSAKSSLPTQVVSQVVKVLKNDADSDGILDENDQCPNSNPKVTVNQFGCAEGQTAKIGLNVQFALGKSQLNPKSKPQLNNLVNFMKKFEDTKIEVAGHSDNIGESQANMILSQKRAEAVKLALIKAGIKSTRLTAKGYGSSQPITDNKTETEREQNRRVTVEISTNSIKK